MKLQFRLRALMIAVTLLAVPLDYVGWQAKIVRERKAASSQVVGLGGKVFRASEISQLGPDVSLKVYEPKLTPFIKVAEFKPPFPSVSFIRAWLGDEYVLFISLPKSTTQDTAQSIRDVFPEALVMVTINQ